jgi:BMFP domain-containing protein YqiC
MGANSFLDVIRNEIFESQTAIVIRTTGDLDKVLVERVQTSESLKEVPSFGSIPIVPKFWGLCKSGG